MPLLDKIPTMTDEALANLLGNAERLEQSGTPAQRTAAGELLPAIREELSQRRANKRAAPPKTARKRPAARGKAH